MQYLVDRNQNGWSEQLDEYNKLKIRLRELSRQGLTLQRTVNRLYDELKEIKAAIRDTELAKGDHFRSVIDWTSEETQRREQYDRDIAELLVRRKETLSRIREVKSEREALERQGEAALIRDRITTIEVNAEMERMKMIRNAILTRKGLVHTQHRPAAWWIPMVDPSGEWFRRIASTTELYLEPLE
jgi:chromosome segregation ATPase